MTVWVLWENGIFFLGIRFQMGLNTLQNEDFIKRMIIWPKLDTLRSNECNELAHSIFCRFFLLSAQEFSTKWKFSKHMHGWYTKIKVWVFTKKPPEIPIVLAQTHQAYLFKIAIERSCFLITNWFQLLGWLKNRKICISNSEMMSLRLWDQSANRKIVSLVFIWITAAWRNRQNYFDCLKYLAEMSSLFALMFFVWFQTKLSINRYKTKSQHCSCQRIFCFHDGTQNSLYCFDIFPRRLHTAPQSYILSLS